MMLQEYHSDHSGDSETPPWPKSIGIVSIPGVSGADAEEWLEQHYYRSLENEAYARLSSYADGNVAGDQDRMVNRDSDDNDNHHNPN